MNQELENIVIDKIRELQRSNKEFNIIKSRNGGSYLIFNDEYKGRIDLVNGITCYDVDENNNPTRYRQKIASELFHKVKKYREITDRPQRKPRYFVKDVLDELIKKKI